MRSQRIVLPTFAFLLLAFSTYLSADSKVRFVRLSFVQGSVLIDRDGDGRGFQPAVQNMPVIESTRVWTGDTGLAEVELENGSTVRLTGDTRVRFEPLRLGVKGERMSGINIWRGTAYLFLQRNGHDIFWVNNLPQEIKAPAHLRVSVKGQDVIVAVYRGKIHDPWSGATIHKNQSFRMHYSTGVITDIEQGIDALMTDAWDEEREKYRKNPDQNPGLATASLVFPGYAYDNCWSGFPWGSYGVWTYGCGSSYVPSWYYWSFQPTPPPEPSHPVRPPRDHGHGDVITAWPSTVVNIPQVVSVASSRPSRSGTPGVPGSTSGGGSGPSNSLSATNTRPIRGAVSSDTPRWAPVHIHGSSSGYSSGGGQPSTHSGGSSGGSSYGGTSTSRASSSSGSSSSSSASSGHYSPAPSAPSSSSSSTSSGSSSANRPAKY